MFSVYLRAGLAAGLLAGLLAGAFAFLAGEPLLEEAIRLEERHAHHHHPEPFGRTAQKAGLIAATSLYGLAAGGVFGLLSAYLRGRTDLRDGWSRSLILAGAAFLGTFLLPFLKYPPYPPGVEPAVGVGSRTLYYLAALILSSLAIFFAWRLAKRLSDLSRPARHLAAGGFLAGCWALLFFLLPAVPAAGEFPAGLLWDYRLSVLGTQGVLWAGIGVLFGLLARRAERRVA
ncbi:hypothetical protein E0L93_14470 [Rubrobacter taiwanensis]|jgi:predicted cobalt transporter CbtA|uniref:CbtA family protein n=1 Tax=Rubrobacter taiwanensis TaxID=185139 RepID=A0A4V2NVI7_9ACTN|nr:CbtA family protein [Rubrobacter taiwanensis]TCJ13622.1 hypothetical protein E0L93_14470 [Rubrobacter taiwanensis]